MTLNNTDLQETYWERDRMRSLEINSWYHVIISEEEEKIITKIMENEYL